MVDKRLLGMGGGDTSGAYKQHTFVIQTVQEFNNSISNYNITINIFICTKYQRVTMQYGFYMKIAGVIPITHTA